MTATGALLAALWLGVWWTLDSEYRLHTRLALSQADSAAQRLADRSSKLLDQFKQTLLLNKHLYERDGHIDFGQLKGAGLTGERERQIAFIIGPDGVIIDDSDGTALGHDVSDREYFRATRVSSELVVSRAVYGRIYKRWMVPMALAMHDSLGRFAGASALAFDASVLTDGFALGHHEDAVVAVVRPDGEYLSRRTGGEHSVGERVDPEVIKRLIAQQRRDLKPVPSPVDRRLRFGALMPIEGYGLNALIAISPGSALGGYYTLRTEVLVAALCASLAIVAGAVVLTRQAHRLGNIAAEKEHAERRLVHEKQRLRTSLLCDALTGLPNRAAFEAHLDALLAKEGASPAQHVRMFIDLDQFKVINDTCGHAAGDLLLKQLAQLLGNEIRRRDLLARLGGDEFGVLLEGCPREPALRVAESMRQRLAAFRFVWQDRPFRPFQLSISIGVVPFSAGQHSRVELLRLADSACYVAKEAGRNRVHVYDETDTAVASRSGELDWVSRLQHALAENRFELHGQRIMPIQPGAGHESDHVEILIRLRGEDGRLVSPMAFIPAAERYGLMPAIDRWVITHALAAHAAHVQQSGRAARFAINLSGATLGDPTLLDFVKHQLAAHRVAADSVCFEITETAAIESLEAAAQLIGRLRELGCRIALDDFGCGMSSFAYLKRLPVDCVKIDGGFVKDMLHEPVDYAMVEAIHHIARRMGLHTVAEFVEDQATVEALRSLGVHYVQGYGVQRPGPLLAEPVAMAALPALPQAQAEPA